MLIIFCEWLADMVEIHLRYVRDVATMTFRSAWLDLQILWCDTKIAWYSSLGTILTLFKRLQ